MDTPTGDFITDDRKTYHDESVIPVKQGYFGELTKDTIGLGFNKMETWGVGPCVALVLVGGEDGAILLTHIDLPEKLVTLETNPRYKSVEKAFVILSSQADEKTKAAVLKFAKKHSNTVEVINQNKFSAIIGVDANGKVYEPKGLIDGVAPEGSVEKIMVEVYKDILSGNLRLRPMAPLLRTSCSDESSKTS
jgi:hypothetical protein